jgi:prophage regulatory protein
MASRPEITNRKTDRRLLDYKALRRERGIPWTRIHISRLEATGKFPLHINVGASSIAWFADEIDDFLELKAAERDAKRDAKAAALAAKADSSTDCDRPLGVARKRQKPIAATSASASGRPEHT